VSRLTPLLPFPEIALEEQTTDALPPEPSGPPDAAARAQALDIRRSFIVEAPAGSGKTGLLIQRYLKLLADDSVTAPEQVLAITFTLKATAELRDRVLAHLEAARRGTTDRAATGLATTDLATTGLATTDLGAPGLDFQTWDMPANKSIDEPLQIAASGTSGPDETSEFAQESRALAQAVLLRDRRLDWQLLDHPHRLNIRTIDSVCAQIAATLPVLSGSGGRLSPATDAQPLYREAARRTLLLLGSGDPLFDDALRDLLLHRDGNLADCETLLADMLALREQWGSLIPLTPSTLDNDWLDGNVLPRLQRTLEQAICAELTALTPLIDDDILADLTLLAADMAHSDGYKGEPSPIAPCKGRTQSPAANAEDLEHWQALIHLLIKPSKPRDWRRSVTANVVKFAIEKHHEAQLKHIIGRLSTSPALVDTLCRIEALPPARYPANQWAVAKSLFRVLSRALIELQLVFAERAQCDFTELSLLAGAALTADSGPDDLAAALGARLQHLLVDEMQDTSAAQYDLIQMLTASWDGHSQTVFLVGDPRQSIYLFRQARVESFLKTMRTQRLGELPLTRLRLTANFRSQQTLVEQFNRDFAGIFPENPAESLPYAAAIPTLPPSPHASGLHWHANPVEIRPANLGSVSIMAQPHLDVSGAMTAGQDAPGVATAHAPLTPAQLRQRQSRRDAAAIRQIARGWLAKPLPLDRETILNERGETVAKPWQIAVLVRSRSHLADIVAAFNVPDRQGKPIAYRAVDITPLNERQEILDLTALTRVLLHPADRVAGLAVLRAPWCGLSLAALHALTGVESDPESEADPGQDSDRIWSALKFQSIQRLLAERGHLLDEDSIERLTRVWTVLEAAAAQRARLTAAQLVERAWRSLGGDAWLKPEEIINTRRFFELLDQVEAESSTGRIDPTLLASRLQRLYAEPNSVPPGQPFVELLTIHAAKGLEWDVVIVPALERGPGFSRARLLTWSELDTAGDGENAPILLAPIAAKGEPIDALTAWLKEIHKKREAAERKRLFYVAATRAREELHLFAAPDLLSNGNLNPRWDSLLKSAWPAAQSHFTTALSARPASPGASSTQTGAPFLAQSSRDRGGVILDPATIAQDSPEPTVLDGIAAAATLHPMPLRDPWPTATPTKDPRPLDAPTPAPGSSPIQRIPLTFDPAARISAAQTERLPYGDAASTSGFDSARREFARPEGSFAARAFGNTVHAFLELLSTRIAAGHSATAILAELPTWTPRIAAILRSAGLPPATADRLTRETRAALANTLRDPNGLWLLDAHPGAATELAVTTWAESTEAASGPSARSIRVDRIFHAGPEPGMAAAPPEEDCLWIIDYKTASHGPTGLDDFLAKQRATYAPQLEAYAAILGSAQSAPTDRVRLALYYPAIPRLIWWRAPSPKTGNLPTPTPDY
jgi:ATP-dependent helicase/nuclease subunit A